MITFTVQGDYTDLNSYINAERTNRYMAAAIKKREMRDIAMQLRGPLITEKVDITFQAFVKNGRKDPDNIYVMFVKFFLDALTIKGIIPGDGQKHIGRITLEPPQSTIGDPYMTVTLTPHANL